VFSVFHLLGCFYLLARNPDTLAPAFLNYEHGLLRLYPLSLLEIILHHAHLFNAEHDDGAELLSEFLAAEVRVDDELPLSLADRVDDVEQSILRVLGQIELVNFLKEEPD